VHQGDRDGNKGLYHINAVDEVTQWEIVAATPQDFRTLADSLLEQLLEQFPFMILGFHSDNGKRVHNYVVQRTPRKAAHRTDKSRAYRSGDNGLVESKNGAIIRKHIGFGTSRAACETMNRFHREYLNPYVNFHGPAPFTDRRHANGKRRRVYRVWATPFEIFSRMPHCEATCGPVSAWRNSKDSPVPSPIPKPPSDATRQTANASPNREAKRVMAASRSKTPERGGNDGRMENEKTQMRFTSFPTALGNRWRDSTFPPRRPPFPLLKKL